VSLRTYSLVTHPAFIRHVEASKGYWEAQVEIAPIEAPSHRPKLKKLSDICDFLGVSHEIIHNLRLHKDAQYRTFTIEKKSGGTREISSPRTFLKVIQWWILDTILYNAYVPEVAFGFVRERSFLENARAHVGNTHVLNVDVENFFSSIKTLRVRNIFKELGYNELVATGLADLTTLKGCLPQGAPTSPMLANLAFSECDQRLRQLSDGIGATYTRYADDITFSSKLRLPLSLPSDIGEVIAEHGFKLNPKKTKFMGPNQTKEVTGLILGRDGIALNRGYLNAARGWFHSAKCYPERYRWKVHRIAGTLQLIKQVGGRGSARVISLGEEALAAVRRSNLQLLR
jgi:retron-type reverse transcriptase